MPNHFLSRSVLAGLALLACAAPAAAAITVNIVETGSDVVATFSGTLDLTGYVLQPTFGGPFAPSGEISPFFGVYASRPGGFTDLYFDQGQGGGAIFGSGKPSYTTIATGDDLLFAWNAVQVPKGYAGEQISGSMTFIGANFASMGITPGTYFFPRPNDMITLIATPVPEPGVWAMMVAGLGVLGAATRRRGERAVRCHA